MEVSTNTCASVPVCENCGRDKQATYICDPCCDKLNAAIRALRAERDRLAAENEDLQKNAQLLPFLHREVSDLEDTRDRLNATLDKLREVVLEEFGRLNINECDGYIEASAIHASRILYPKETTDDND